MKIHFLSDLHMEFSAFNAAETDADLVILLGDIHVGVEGVKWAAESYSSKEVWYVPGNHEYYGFCYQSLNKAMLAEADVHPNITVAAGFPLSKVFETKLGPVRVIAATLWTDFKLFGPAELLRSGLYAEFHMSDFKLIKVNDNNLSWVNAAKIHELQLAWIKAEVNKAKKNGERVVIATHHGPSIHCVAARFTQSQLSPAFVSNLEYMLPDVDFWLYGHTHENIDKYLHGCRVMSNQRGYTSKSGVVLEPDTHTSFNPQLTINLA